MFVNYVQFKKIEKDLLFDTSSLGASCSINNL